MGTRDSYTFCIYFSTLYFEPQIMKKFIYSLLVVFLATVSCTKADFHAPVTDFDDHGKSLIVRNDSNRVSITDIYGIIAKDFPQTKGSIGVNDFEVTSYVRNRTDTLMYILNTGGNGWKIYSPDKRTPAILAEGDRGSFSLEDGSPAVAVWLDCLANDMERVLESSDDELTFSSEDIQAYKGFWNRSSGQTEEVQDVLDSIVRPFPLPLPKGHWEEEIYSTVIEYDRVDHMVPKWDQWSPYNRCCPYYVSNPTQRACAGCVAVAGAQILYYLHNKLGVPHSAYSYGTCVGNVDSYQRHFTHESTEVWEQMSVDYISPNDTLFSGDTLLPEAVLIGYVGALVDMHYRDNILFDIQYSWALPRNIKDNVLDYYNISSSRGDYDEDVVQSNLLNQMPVVVSATNLLIPADFNIHCFVIDGYRRMHTKYTYYHYFVIEEPPTRPVTMPAPYSTYSYSEPEMTAVKINWGWHTQWDEDNPLNDGWYTLTGGWTVVQIDETYDYNHNRNMIYGFEYVEPVSML